mmetsp:Transcript_16142/g.21214  ORF Transcript_16142/g.21214 Transcript_16142/m.21214 type:complete len:365 (-) Transcript_16142:549-1643(-)
MVNRNPSKDEILSLAEKKFIEKTKTKGKGYHETITNLEKESLLKNTIDKEVYLYAEWENAKSLSRLGSQHLVAREELLLEYPPSEVVSLAKGTDLEEIFLNKVLKSSQLCLNLVHLKKFDIFVYKSSVLSGILSNCQTVPRDISRIEPARTKENGMDFLEGTGQNDDGENDEMVDPKQAVEFLRCAGKLKRTLRTGWVLRGIENPESVCDHSWRVALCSYLITDKRIDKKKSGELGLLHDISEAIVGDIAPGSGISKAEKEKLEHGAILHMTKDILRDHKVGKMLRSLWQEYEDRESIESSLVKDFDLFEMILQADEYEISNPSVNLEEFFKSVEGRIKHPEVQAWHKELLQQRGERLKHCDSS